MYVTKKNMATAVANLTKHLEHVSDALAVSPIHPLAFFSYILLAMFEIEKRPSTSCCLLIIARKSGSYSYIVLQLHSHFSLALWVISCILISFNFKWRCAVLNSFQLSGPWKENFISTIGSEDSVIFFKLFLLAVLIRLRRSLGKMLSFGAHNECTGLNFASLGTNIRHLIFRLCLEE